MTTTTERNDSQQPTQTLGRVTAGNELTVGTKKVRRFDAQAGKIGWAILWLLGVPLPVLLIVYLIWGR